MTCRNYWNCLGWDLGEPCPCFPDTSYDKLLKVHDYVWEEEDAE